MKRIAFALIVACGLVAVGIAACGEDEKCTCDCRLKITNAACERGNHWYGCVCRVGDELVAFDQCASTEGEAIDRAEELIICIE